MKKLLIKSEGFTIHNSYFPPFELHENELLCIIVTPAYLCNEIYSVFSGKKKVEGLNIIEPFKYIEIISYIGWFKRLLKMDIVANFLKAKGIKDIENFCKSLKINPKESINQLSNGQKKLLTLKLAFDLSNHYISFTGYGVDPYSVIEVYDLVKSHIDKRGAAIEVLVGLDDFPDYAKVVCSEVINSNSN